MVDGSAIRAGNKKIIIITTQPEFCLHVQTQIVAYAACRVGSQIDG